MQELLLTYDIGSLFWDGERGNDLTPTPPSRLALDRSKRCVLVCVLCVCVYVYVCVRLELTPWWSASEYSS